MLCLNMTVLLVSFLFKFVDTSEDVQRPPLAKHVLHIGIDGLRPDCMVDATSGLPNIMGRIAHEGTYTLTNARTVVWLADILFHTLLALLDLIKNLN